MGKSWPLITRAESFRRLYRIKDTKQSDCRGTALYLAGMQPFDIAPNYTLEFHQRVLSSLEFSDLPIPGWLASFERFSLPDPSTKNRPILVPHMAIVHHISPQVLLTHRDGLGGQVLPNQPLSKILDQYNEYQPNLTYYRPEPIDPTLLRE